MRGRSLRIAASHWSVSLTVVAESKLAITSDEYNFSLEISTLAVFNIPKFVYSKILIKKILFSAVLGYNKFCLRSLMAIMRTALHRFACRIAKYFYVLLAWNCVFNQTIPKTSRAFARPYVTQPTILPKREHAPRVGRFSNYAFVFERARRPYHTSTFQNRAADRCAAPSSQWRRCHGNGYYGAHAHWAPSLPNGSAHVRVGTARVWPSDTS